MSRRLKALRVGNFKAFADTQTIPLKPITLVFGPNSAGKSSFIHSLALAHEAQFGRDKHGRARLDVHHTDIGGSSIDLGGYRQFVHRGQLRNGVEWGAELKVAELGDSPRYRQLKQLLSVVDTMTLNITLGIVLDDNDRPVAGTAPHIRTMEILADGVELLRMSRRPSEDADDRAAAEFSQQLKESPEQAVKSIKDQAAKEGVDLLSMLKEGVSRSDGELENRALQTLRVDRMASDHAVFAQVIQAIVETQTFALKTPEAPVDEALGNLLSKLEVRVEHFLPSAVVMPESDVVATDEITKALEFWLPRTLNDLIKGLSDVFARELKQLQYLGPLRSFPARHVAFAENEDANWYAGGGYAWDVVRNDHNVRKAVNGWLGSDKLKTPYELRIKELVNYAQLRDVEAEVSDSWFFTELSEDLKEEGKPYEEEVKEDFEFLMTHERDEAFAADRIEVINELVLMDMRTKTSVTHRDVGIGISQVLPVLVMAYASRGKLLAMEQPEIHLHPALQAELGDVFIDSALGERGNTFILETHSEHLILRLLRRVREGKLSADDISVLYVQPTGAGSQVLQIRVDEDGDFIDRWPGGFFEESFHERESGY